MKAKKVLVFLILALFLGSCLYSQTLAEIAAKERERRASLKGKKSIVVTNADLAKLKKKAALEIPATEEPPVKEEVAIPPPPSPPAQESQPKSVAEEPAPEDNSRPTLQELQQKWETAKEYVELLTLKMGALWQQFNSLDATSPKEAVQLAISETFLKLEKAQDEEARARQELEKFLGQAKKDTVPEIWIR